MPLKKNKSVGEFPRVRISEEFPRIKISTEFPRVRISEEFPRKSIVTEPPFGKDIVNLEKKYGTVSGYKMYPFGRAQEEFVEQDHPREDSGKFTTKGGGSSDIPKPIDRPSGNNYRVEAKKAMLAGRIKAETEFIEAIKAKSQLTPERVKELEGSVDIIRKRMSRVEEEDRKLGLPHIPMGKNTHTKNKDGYVYNKTNIKLQVGVKEDLVSNMMQERIKGMWNSLPDHTRDLVKNLVIKRSVAKGSHWQGGRWVDETRTITINMHPKTHTSLDHNFFHEIGHARWHDLKRTNPEKVKKFRESQKEIGFAPTAYARSYVMIKERNDDIEANYRRKMKQRELPISQKGEERLVFNRNAAEDLYHNEIHSELNAYAMGTISKESITVPKDKMTQLLNIYKEMWDLE